MYRPSGGTRIHPHVLTMRVLGLGGGRLLLLLHIIIHQPTARARTGNLSCAPQIQYSVAVDASHYHHNDGIQWVFSSLVLVPRTHAAQGDWDSTAELCSPKSGLRTGNATRKVKA